MLYPEFHADVDPVIVYGKAWREIPARRPNVVMNMIESVDAQTALAGRSGGLGGDADKSVFRALRTMADMVLAGAGTVRAENYGPAELPGPLRRMRSGRGQAPVPRIATITRSLDLDWQSRLFEHDADGGNLPVVITCGAAPEDKISIAREHAEVFTCGDESVDLAEALGILRHEAGVESLLVEGGPSLNSRLLAEGLVDEINLSISPMVTGGDSARPFGDPLVEDALQSPEQLELAHVLADDGFLFLRYLLPMRRA